MGIRCHSDKLDFEWPTAREIVHYVRRGELLVLTQVRLKGTTSLEGIQLVFNNGALESPFFSSVDSVPHSPESTQSDGYENTYEVGGNGRTIRQIIVSVSRLVLITSLEMRYSDGEVAFSHCFDPSTTPSATRFTQDIPDGHLLVGVYGRQHCLDITSLGFITMQRKQHQQ